MTILSITSTPTIAECRSILADGRVLTITASRRPRANRAEVKCSVPGAPAIAERMQEVVRLARHTEVRFDSRDQVVLSMDIAPGDAERDWELAAVLADRAVRGLFQPVAGVQTVAHGWSDRWHLGQLSGRADGGSASVGTMQVTHLGALTGHADPSAAVSTVRAWFPLHSGGVNDELAWVEVSVFPIDAGPATVDVSANATHTAAANSEEDTIAAPGLDLSAQQDIRQTLAEAHHAAPAT